MHIEAKLAELGLMLPEPMKPPPGVAEPPTWIRVRGNIAYLSGQSARNPDGSPAGPFGKVPTEVSVERAIADAQDRLTNDETAIAERRHRIVQSNANRGDRIQILAGA